MRLVIDLLVGVPIIIGTSAGLYYRVKYGKYEMVKVPKEGSSYTRTKPARPKRERKLPDEDFATDYMTGFASAKALDELSDMFE